nr:porin [Enterobacter hormaechei]MDI6423267.1 porin [Enterobacter hormaechei]MDI6434930.1 porin [Enterobacter hormaechei]
MKRKVLAILVPALLMAGAVNAAEMYNKNGNKVDLYGKVDARHTFSDNPGDDGDETRNMTPYGDDGIADKTQNFEAVAQYQFDFGLRPSLAWVYSKGKDMTYPGYAGNPQGQKGDMDLVNYIDVGMTYSFNKNFSTYVDYKINLLDEDDAFYNDNGIATDDVVGVGMTYQF